MPSAAIEFANYDPTDHVLMVKFRSGHLYCYMDVPEEAYKGLRSSRSKGRYINQHIKSQYRCVKAY
jgi:hypothetical protein